MRSVNTLFRNHHIDITRSTGATGYIAGDALHALYNAHPEYTYACLVRSQEKGDLVQKAYPKVRLVIGGLDDSELLEDEAAKADVVLRKCQDHAGKSACYF